MKNRLIRILTTATLIAILLVAFVAPQFGSATNTPSKTVNNVTQQAIKVDTQTSQQPATLSTILQESRSVVVTPNMLVDENGNSLGITEIDCNSPDKGNTFAVDKGVDLSQITVDFAGDWTLASDITVNVVQVNSGAFDTGKFRINSSFMFVGQDYNAKDILAVNLNDSVINCPWWTVYRGLTDLTFRCGTSVINTRNFFGGGQTYNVVNFINGKSYNLEDDSKIVSVTIAGDSKSTSVLYIRGDNVIGNPIVTTGTVSYKKAYDASAKEVGQASPIGVAEYQKASITVGKVTLSSQIREDWSDVVCWWNGLVSSNGVSADTNPRYWVGGTGNINDDTFHWATVSNGAPGLGNLPTSTNNAVFDGSSFSGGGQIVTVNATFNCADFDWSLATNTPEIKGSSALSIYGNLIYIAAMTQTYSGTITFASTSAGKTVTCGKTLACVFKFDGVNGGWTLQDTTNLGTNNNFQIANGTLNTNGVTITCQNFQALTGTKVVTLGNSTINCYQFTMTSANTTFNANTSTINGTGNFSSGSQTYNIVNLSTANAASFSGGGTYATLTRIGASATTDNMTFDTNIAVTGNFTFTGNSPSNRLFIKSAIFNTPRTINCTGATTNFTDVDFQDIVISGTPTVGTNVRVGDCGGNTGQTFTAAVPKYWVGNGGSWSDATNHWATSEGGGAGANNYPLPQDTAYFKAGSISSGGQTVTMDEPRYSGIDFSSVANTPVVSLSNALYHFGSLDLTGVGTYTHNNYTQVFQGRTASLLKSNGLTLRSINIQSPTGSLTLQDNLALSNSVTLSNGTFDLNNKNIVCLFFSSSNSNTRTLTLGNGTLTIQNNSSTVFEITSTCTITLNTATIIITGTATTGQIFNGGSTNFNGASLTQQGTGNYALTIQGSNTFATLTIDRSVAAKTLKITNSTIQTCSNFVCATNGVVVLTITNSSSTTAGTLTKTGGGTISMDYVNVSYNTATPSYTWSYGANGVPGSGVTGWSNGTPTDTLYWVADSGSWSDSAHHWAAASNGTPNAIFIPLADVSVSFDSHSFSGGGLTVTQDSATAACLNMDWTNATNTPTWAGSSALSIYGNLTFIAGMTQTYTGTITLAATASGKTVTCGKTLACPITVNGVGGAWTLQDTMNLTAQTFTLTAGSFTSNSQAMTTTGIVTISGSTTRTFNGSGSTVNCGTWTATTTTGLTFTAPAVLSVNGASGTFNNGSLTYTEVDITGAAQTIATSSNYTTLKFINPSAAQTVTITSSTTQTVSGTFTATGQSTTNRCTIKNSSGATHATISAGTVAVTKATISYITASGAGNWDLSASANDVLQGVAVNSCTGITFGLYWYKDTGNWTNIAQWSSVSGATANAVVVPDATTRVFFDANSFSTGTRVVTVNGTATCLSMDWIGATNTPAFAGSSAMNTYGNVTLIGAGMTTTYSGTWTFNSIAGTCTLNTGGLALANPITINDALGTVQLGTNGLDIGAQTFTLTAGIFITNSLPLTTTGIVTISGSTTRTFNMSGSTVTCGTWTATTTTLLIYTTDASSKIVVTGATTFNGGSIATYKEVDLDGSGTTIIAGSNTFVTLALPSATTQTIQFTDGTTQHITTATLSGSLGHIHTLTGTSTAGWNIVKDGGGQVLAQYCTITYSVASPASTWYYDATSTYNSTSGWNLYTPLAITISAASLITGTTARLNGNVTAVGYENPAVTVYWGTTDGGQTPGSWQHSATPPTSPGTPTEGIGAFYNDVASLTSSTDYFFAAKATNSFGTAWVTASLTFRSGSVICKINGIDLSDLTIIW